MRPSDRERRIERKMNIPVSAFGLFLLAICGTSQIVVGGLLPNYHPYANALGGARWAEW